jgi:hypothetical protein
MRNTMLIAKREYLEQVRGRAFRLSTIGLPALFAVIIGVGYVASLGLGANKHLVIMANDAALADAIRTQIVSDKDGTPMSTWPLPPRLTLERSSFGRSNPRPSTDFFPLRRSPEDYRRPHTPRNPRAISSPTIGSSKP